MEKNESTSTVSVFFDAHEGNEVTATICLDADGHLTAATRIQMEDKYGNLVPIGFELLTLLAVKMAEEYDSERSEVELDFRRLGNLMEGAASAHETWVKDREEVIGQNERLKEENRVLEAKLVEARLVAQGMSSYWSKAEAPLDSRSLGSAIDKVRREARLQAVDSAIWGDDGIKDGSHTYLLLPNVQAQALKEVINERKRQDSMWGEQGYIPDTWLSILVGEVGEVARAIRDWRFKGGDSGDIRWELSHVAAVAVAVIECFERGGVVDDRGRSVEGVSQSKDL